MPKTKISEYDATAANNTDVNSINIAEGCAPSGINNAIRQVMADLKDFQQGTKGDPFLGPVTPSTLTLTGLTANRILYTNGSKVVSTSDNVQFDGTTVTINSLATTSLSTSGVATFSAGTVSAPAITTTGDTNTGIFFPAADTIAFTEGGVESMRITDLGNVGIGTSSPAQRLHVYFGASGGTRTAGVNTLITEGNAAVGLQFLSPSTTSQFIFFGDESSSQSGRIVYEHTNNALAINTNGAERMRIDSVGKLLVGTTSIVGNNRLVVAGALGASTDNSGGAIRLINTDSGNYASINAGIVGLSNNGMQFATDGVSRMVIDSGGNLLVGTTNSGEYGVTQANVVAQHIPGTKLAFKAVTSATAAATLMAFVNPNGSVGAISTNGSATTYATSSDYRLKENIKLLTGALDVVQQLKPVTYNWKVDGSASQGFIAHELQEIAPECVTGEKDAVDTEGKPIYQGIDTSFLVATLTAAIQELKATVDAQAARIAALENN